MNQRHRAFTLMELLVVIAVVGILSAMVLAGMNTSRQRARDAKRIADVLQLKLSLELYFDVNGKYPGQLSDLVSSGFILTVPTPPTGVSGVAAYTYVPLGSTCINYHLGIPLEIVTNAELAKDVDLPAAASVGSNCGGSAVIATTDFSGLGHPKCTDPAGTAQPNGTEACFDVTP